MIYIGDGLNDYEVYQLVSRFIGYGGAYYRQNIADLCEFYAKSASLAAILPLLLTQEEYHQLNATHQLLYNKGLADILDNRVQIK
jgi:phosphoserine phosphatase